MEVLQTGQTLRSDEDFFVHKDGRMIPISCSVAPIRSDSTIGGAVMVVRDLPQQKLAEATERENEEALQQAQKLEVDGVVGADTWAALGKATG